MIAAIIVMLDDSTKPRLKKEHVIFIDYKQVTTPLFAVDVMWFLLFVSLLQ